LKFRLVMLVVLCVTAGVISGCIGPIERPVADFDWCPNGYLGNLDYQFTSTSRSPQGTWIESMEWEFDDGTPPDAAWDAWHRFEDEGRYHVTLTVKDSRGVPGTVTREVNVFPAVEVFPNWQLTLGWPIRVAGIIANRADVRLDAVVVKAKFYDTDGVRIADGTVTIDDIAPGEKVAYSIDAPEYSARIFHATVEIDSFVADCGNPWFMPFADQEIQ
jgi:PKD repeat protein